MQNQSVFTIRETVKAFVKIRTFGIFFKGTELRIRKRKHQIAVPDINVFTLRTVADVGRSFFAERYFVAHNSRVDEGSGGEKPRNGLKAIAGIKD